ncbi:hypothetical protein [Achromobacter xylosoxidans]|uniref:hypothetical protein n=1 Tax=Alcaligenes xylosoxydans xylosoxydans TaxID=85698 RepID=UPI0011776B2E|nr:hypothetical protein [Achromobacter xylosoxidans]
MSEKTEGSSSNNRWWESYLVRYFSGFIVGAICVAIIAKFSGLMPRSISLALDSQSSADSEPKYSVTFIIVAISLLGLAYCYVASTPITVLHAGRYSKGPVDRLSRFFWLGWVLVLGVLMVFPGLATFQFSSACTTYTVVLVVSVVGISLWALGRFSTPSSRDAVLTETSPNDSANSRVSEYGKCDYFLVIVFFVVIWSFSQAIPRWFGVLPEISDARLLAIGAPVVWIGLAQYFVLFKIFYGSKENYEFYRKLFAARQKIGAKDVRDTYSHLREHSNAIFIVAVEISMLALMLSAIKIERAANNTHASLLDGATFWLSALGIWIVPTIFMWSRANAMERYFSENPSDFIAENSEISATRYVMLSRNCRRR